MASNPWMERQKEPSDWPEGSFLYFFPIFLLNSIIHLEIGIFFLSWRTFSRFCPHPPKKPQVFGGMNFFDKFRARHRHHNLPSIVYYLLSFIPVYLPQSPVIQSPLLHAELRRRLGRRRLQGHTPPAQGAPPGPGPRGGPPQPPRGRGHGGTTVANINWWNYCKNL